MDFKLSYNWLREFVDVRVSPEELAELLSLHSVSVERIHRFGADLDGVVVGVVERVEAHPNADTLMVAYVVVRPPSASGISNWKSQIRVVCGGVNLREGMCVAYARTGARVRWHGEGDRITLEPAEIRGVRSEGMICAASEIGLRELFLGGEKDILDLSFLGASAVGKPLAVALGLDDATLDVEVTPNRPDLMSVEELAREVAAITGASFRPTPMAIGGVEKSQSVRPGISRLRSTALEMTKWKVRIEGRADCPRYGAVVIDGVAVGPSPWDVQRKLLTAGMRPVNNIVDATNLVMLELGQPLHAFDAAKVGDAIHVRRARHGESLLTLDGQAHALTPDVLVIASAEQPIAIAGIIGGTESSVTVSTTRIVLEAATFNPMVIRKGARVVSVRTDAAIRFEKGLQPEAIDAVLPYAIARIIALAGGTAGKPVIAGGKVTPMRPITFQPARASAKIGVAIPAAAMRRTLTAIGCRVAGSAASWRVTPSWWRRGDLAASHDLIEEVARFHGYHRLPSVLPVGTLPAAARSAMPARTSFDIEQRCRELLADLGAVEVMPYSLTGAQVIAQSGHSMDQAVALENPLSEEFAYLRPSLITTMLPVIAQNQGHAPHGMLFELGNVYIPNAERRTRDGELPREELRLCIAAYGRLMGGGHVEKVKGVVERIFAALGVRNAEFRVSEQSTGNSGASQWHPGRTMDVVAGGALIGVIGEVHPLVVEASGIDARVAVADIDWSACAAVSGQPRPVDPLPMHPAVKRDLAVIVDRTTTYAALASALAAADPALVGFELFDQYEGGNIPPGKKSLAFHLEYRAPDRTLTAEEVDRAHVALTTLLGAQFGAEVRE